MGLASRGGGRHSDAGGRARRMLGEAQPTDPYNPSTGMDAGFDCEIEALCPTRTNWRKINEAVIAALDGISLADMAPQKAPRISYKFQIKEFVEN